MMNPQRLRTACDRCTAQKLACTHEKPACQRCVRRGHPEGCTYSQARPAGRPRRRPTNTGNARNDTSPDQADERTEFDAFQSSPQPHADNNEDGEALVPSNVLYGQPADGILDNVAYQTQSSFGNDTGPLTTLSTLSLGEQANDHFTTDHDSWMGLFMDVGEQSLPNCGSSRQDFGYGLNFTSSSFATPTMDHGTEDMGFFHECGCSKPISELTASTVTSSLPENANCPALDVLFGAGNLAHAAKSSMQSCGACHGGSTHVAMLLCTAMNWVLDNLRPYCEGDAYSSMQPTHSANMSSLASPFNHGIHAGIQCSSTALPRLSVGQFALSEEEARVCIAELLKLQLRRLHCNAKEMSGSKSGEDGIPECLVLLSKDVCEKAEAVFGMIDSW